MTKTPWTDPFPNLPRSGIHRRFAASEAQKPPVQPSSGPEGPKPGATADARRAASSIRKHRGDAAPTILKAPDLGKSTAVAKIVKKSVVRPKIVDVRPKTSETENQSKRPRGRPKSSAKPWIAAGVSKATWFRQKAKAKGG
jgi:hypothetical protein